MRRHPAIAASLAITLALGGTALVSFAAAADPPPAGWTASVSPPVYTNDLYFSGTKPEGETADSVVVSTAAGDEEIASWACTGFDDLYATVWDCYYDGAMPVGDGTIYFGGEVISAPFSLDFTVDEVVVPDPDPVPSPDPTPDPTPEVSTIPDMEYAFLPAGIVITGTPTGIATKVAIELYEYTEGWGLYGGCPDHSEESEYGTFDGAPTGANVCYFDELAPGAWNPYSQQDLGDGEQGQDEYVDDYFVVSETPTILTATRNSDRSVTLTGEGEPYFHALVIEPSTEALVCETDVDEVGDWTCTTAALSTGLHTFAAYTEDTGGADTGDLAGSHWLEGGLSALSDSESVTVPSPPAPPTPPAPTPGPTTPPTIDPVWNFTITGIDPNNLHPGDVFSVTGGGLPPGALLGVELHSTPVSLGATTVSSTGAYDLKVTVPLNVELGAHAIVVTLSGAGITTSTKQQPVTVRSAELATSGAGEGTAEGGSTAEQPVAESDPESGLEHSAAAPNILTNSMKPIMDVLNDPARIGVAFAAGLVLLIFAILPAHLLNTTIGEQYERLARRMPILSAQPKWYHRMRAAFSRAPALGGILLTTTTAFLFVFADPNFGLNLPSLRLFLALAGALFAVTYLANAITAAIMRRGWSVDVEVQLRPLGLVLTVAGVVASRLLDFSPGFLIGLVLGLTIASHAAAQHAWRAVLIRTMVITTFAFGSWVLYSSMAADVHHDPTFWNELVLEFFVAIVTEGTVMLLVELLPFHLLEGERLFVKSRVLWAGIYSVLLTLFILAVVPWEGNWRELGPTFWPWFTAVGVFGVVCVGIYLYFRYIAPPLHHDAHESTGPEPVGANDVEEDELVAMGDDS